MTDVAGIGNPANPNTVDATRPEAPDSESGDGRPAGEMDRLAWFGALWAAAVLIHQGSYGDWSTDPLDLALTAAAALVVVQPRRLSALIALLILVVADVAFELPWISNHWLFAAFVSATLLAAIVRPGRFGTGAHDREAAFEAFAPWARLQLLVLYAAAVVHKLNSDFLDPEKSCAFVQSSALFEMLGFPASSVGVVLTAIYGTLAVEIAIPILLIFRRTRWLGIALGIVFHGALGLNTLVAPFYNFSSLLFASYALFLPDDYPAVLRKNLPAAMRRSVALIFGVTMLSAAALGVVSGAAWPVDSAVVRGLWALYCCALLAFLAVASGRGKSGSGGPLLGRYPALAVFPALLLFDASSPYLGLKTETSFAMFSNLRTEGDLGNHLLLRRVPQLAGYQQPLVEVLESSDPGLQRVAESPMRFVFFEFRAYTSQHPNNSVSYRHGDRTHRVERIADDPVLSRPHPTWQRKLLHFRLVDTGGRCRH